MVRKKSFVLAFSVSYPGDFYMKGHWWRAIKEVVAKDAESAVMDSAPTKELPDGCEIVVATSYPPAFDVVRARELARTFS
jgi:hypothetical protein